MCLQVEVGVVVEKLKVRAYEIFMQTVHVRW